MLALVLSIAGLMAATPSVITNPDWMRTPSAEEMADHYPERARSAWLDGEATIVCRVSIKGRLNNCEVAVETPEGYGFGAAALGLSGLFEMKPQMLNGMPQEGGMVRIPISFRMPAMEMSDLDPAIQCYGLLGAEVDADPSDSETAAAVQALKANLASVAARGGLGWDDLRATMAAARAKPTKDAELIGVCRQQLEAWKAGRP